MRWKCKVKTANELSHDSIRVFSASAYAAPLKDAAEIFTRQTGIHVQIDICAQHCASQEAEQASGEAAARDFLIEIAEYGLHDLSDRIRLNRAKTARMRSPRTVSEIHVAVLLKTGIAAGR